MIRADNLHKTFYAGFFRKPVKALQGLSLEVEKGEIFGFLGPNGAGKTTFIKILVGLIKPTAGEAFILGKPAGEVKTKNKIGFLPEQPDFYQYLSGEEFLNFCSQFFPLTPQEQKQRINYLLDLVGLERARGLALRKYSKGMLQRIGLAQALINDPELVILDEPMSGLDPIGRKEIRDLISRLGNEGKTVFFNTHILSDVEVICDRVGIIHQGKLLKVGTIQELASATLQSWEIQAEIKNPELKKELEQRGASGEFSISWQKDQALIRLNDEQKAQEMVKLILEKGGQLMDYSGHRQSLEDYFWKTIGGNQQK